MPISYFCLFSFIFFVWLENFFLKNEKMQGYGRTRTWQVWDTAGPETASAQYLTLLWTGCTHTLHGRTRCSQPPRQHWTRRRLLDRDAATWTRRRRRRGLDWRGDHYPQTSSLSSQSQVTRQPLIPQPLPILFFWFSSIKLLDVACWLAACLCCRLCWWCCCSCLCCCFSCLHCLPIMSCLLIFFTVGVLLAAINTFSSPLTLTW